MADVPDDPGMDIVLQEIGDGVADLARGYARNAGLLGPERGIDSIHCEVLRGRSESLDPSFVPADDLPTAYVGWGEEHFYLGFAEVGTEHQAATPFLRPALEQFGG